MKQTELDSRKSAKTQNLLLKGAFAIFSFVLWNLISKEPSSFLSVSSQWKTAPEFLLILALFLLVFELSKFCAFAPLREKDQTALLRVK